METLMGWMGYIGMLCLLSAYFLLTVGQLKSSDMHHILLNALGALLIVMAMQAGSPAPLFLTLLAWLLISLYGFYRHHIAATD